MDRTSEGREPGRAERRDPEWGRLGIRLRCARLDANLSMKTVADRTGISYAAIGAMESGERKVYALELRDLAALYGRPASHFLGEEDTDGGAAGRVEDSLRDLSPRDLARVLTFAEFLHWKKDQTCTEGEEGHE